MFSLFILHHNGSAINIDMNFSCKKHKSFLQYVEAFTNSVIVQYAVVVIRIGNDRTDRCNMNDLHFPFDEILNHFVDVNIVSINIYILITKYMNHLYILYLNYLYICIYNIFFDLRDLSLFYFIKYPIFQIFTILYRYNFFSKNKKNVKLFFFCVHRSSIKFIMTLIIYWGQNNWNSTVIMTLLI